MKQPDELIMETGPLDTWIVGYFTIVTSNLDITSSLQLELPKLDNDEELNFEFLDQEHYFIESRIAVVVLKRYKSIDQMFELTLLGIVSFLPHILIW